MTTPEAIYKTALEHIRDGSDAVCTECGWMGDLEVSQQIANCPPFFCPACRSLGVRLGQDEIAAYALAQGNDDNPQFRQLEPEPWGGPEDEDA